MESPEIILGASSWKTAALSKEKTATGGTHIKSGTYKKQRSVYVNINDLDFFNLVYRTTRFIESWELTYGPKLIRDARKLLSEQRAAAQQ